jgi:ribosomal-protein-alanine N-acetyltransferase
MTGSHFELRTARASDLDAILALERATRNAPHWPLAAYQAILDSPLPQRCLMVAESGDGLAGFAVGLVHPEPERVAELESVVVAGSARRAGIGHALCKAVIDWCQACGAAEVILEVRAGSAAAIALYAGLGFMRAGRRPRYYVDPDDDALAMRLELRPGSAQENEGPR